MNQTEPTFDQLFEVNNLKAQLQAKDTIIKKLKTQIKYVSETSTSENVKKDIDEIETINIELEHRVAKLISEICELENHIINKLFDFFITFTCFCHNNIKNDIRKFKGKDIVDNSTQASNATTLAPGMYKLDHVPLAPMVKNNRESHIYYLKHTMEQAAILREIVEQAKSLNPLDSASYTACKYVKLIQELLGYVRDTCPDIHTPIKPSTSASGSKPSGNTKNDRILRTPSSNEKNKVEVQYSKVKSKLNKQNSDSKNVCNEHVKHPVKVFNSVGYKWKPTRRTFTLVGNAWTLTRITATNKVPLRVPIPLEVVAPNHIVTRVYTRRPKVPKSIPISKTKVIQIVLWYLASGYSKHMTRDRSQLTNFVHKFLDTFKFGNDQVAKIMGYGDYQIGNVTISRVYYVEGLGHNLFSIGQFCDSDLEVAFRKHTCFVYNSEGVDLLLGSRETNLYSLSIGDMTASSPICLLSKATKTKLWLWHRRLSHLKFGALNHLARNGLVCGLPRLKFEKDHLCSACAMGKSKKHSHKPKS
ncbi:retrovirus-related pol polyprotein from transposon TNT 1-94 [Tanacetum coccineum]